MKHPPVGVDLLLSVTLTSVPQAMTKLLHSEGTDEGGYHEVVS